MLRFNCSLAFDQMCVGWGGEERNVALCVLRCVLMQQALNHKSSSGKVHYRIKHQVGRGCLPGSSRRAALPFTLFRFVPFPSGCVG